MVLSAQTVLVLPRGVCSGNVVGEGHTAALGDRRAEYRETIGQAIEVEVAVVQLPHQFLDTDRDSEVVLGRTLDRSGGESATSPAEDQRRAGGRT
jgi:hypothetical protein